MPSFITVLHVHIKVSSLLSSLLPDYKYFGSPPTFAIFVVGCFCIDKSSSTSFYQSSFYHPLVILMIKAWCFFVVRLYPPHFALNLFIFGITRHPVCQCLVRFTLFQSAKYDKRLNQYPVNINNVHLCAL